MDVVGDRGYRAGAARSGRLVLVLLGLGLLAVGGLVLAASGWATLANGIGLLASLAVVMVVRERARPRGR
jgi:hypothetical protein